MKMKSKMFYQILCYEFRAATALKLAILHSSASVRRDIIRKKHFLTMNTMNPHIRDMEFPLVGPLFVRTAELEKDIATGIKKTLIKANIADCHALGQPPLTFVRQVLALVTFPKLLNDPDFPLDAKTRAKEILKTCRGGSTGSYTDSPGIELIRRHITEYIKQRDNGIPAEYKNIFLCGGSSSGIANLLKLFIGEVQRKIPSVLIPIPTYPFYPSILSEFNIRHIGYYLDESKNWGINIAELDRVLTEAKNFSFPRALIVTNPGNPTGQVLTRENMEEIIKFTFKSKLFLIADEIYQQNIYDDAIKFHSFKKVVTEMGEPYNKVELASFMSCSASYIGEGGLRGGYAEIINMHPEVKNNYNKSITLTLCPPILGQICLDIFVNPPKENESSYKQFMTEKTSILEQLKLKANIVSDAFKSFEGFSCNPVQGALYAFPKITIPSKAIAKANREKMSPDVFYALKLLEETGICIMPGSGFGQQPGTYHIRTTILPPMNQVKNMLQTFKEFNSRFIKTYS